MDLGEGAEGWVLPGVHTPFSHQYAGGAVARAPAIIHPSISFESASKM